MDKLVKISIIVACLLAGFGIFFHYVIYLPRLEQERADRERFEKAEAARLDIIERQEALARAEEDKREAKHRDLQRQIKYYDCLERAAKSYDSNWTNECKAQAKARAISLKNCLADPNRGGNQYLGARYCHSTYGGADPGPTCSLPSSIATNINKNHDKAKQQCLAEAKLF